MRLPKAGTAMVEKATLIARRPANVALFDAITLVAKGVKDQLVARRFPIASIRLFTSRLDPESNLTEFAGEAMLITEPDPEALGPLDIAFFCGTREEGARYVDWPGRNGFVAIDLTTATNATATVPLVNAGVNPGAIAIHPGLIATPHPISQMVSSLLAPIVRGPGLRDATVVVFQPASEAGEEGIDELYRQTIAILNFQDLPQEVFGRQMAFNLIPSFLYEGGKAPGDARPESLAREVLKVTGGDYSLALDVVLVPVFHCHAALALVRLRAGGGRDDLLAAFKGVDEIGIGGGSVTPTEKAGKSGLTLAGVRPAAGPSSFWLWAINDNLKSGTARNAVRIAETLLDLGLRGGNA